jgi:hypothetical protein
MARAATSFVLLQPTRVMSAPTLMIGSDEVVDRAAVQHLRIQRLSARQRREHSVDRQVMQVMRTENDGGRLEFYLVIYIVDVWHFK